MSTIVRLYVHGLDSNKGLFITVSTALATVPPVQT